MAPLAVLARDVVETALKDLPVLYSLYLSGNPTLSCPVANYQGWASSNDWDDADGGYGTDGQKNCGRRSVRSANCSEGFRQCLFNGFG